MDSYSEKKLSIRPRLTAIERNEGMTGDEEFQNGTLRPILKMQNDLLYLMVKAFLKMKKNVFYNLENAKREDYIKNNLLTDRMVIHELRGLIIGLFTTAELEYFIENKAAINKRIQSLLLQRIMSFL